MTYTDIDRETQTLKAKIAALEQMIEVFEKSTVEQADKLYKEISARKCAEEDIQRLNAKLERKVEERTKELMEAQEELVRKDKLSTLGRLAGIVGHEIRNPLGVMSNAIYFLNTILVDADETTKEYLDIIENEIQNSERIISDLLEFARTRPPQTKAVLVSELVAHSLGKCKIPENVRVEIDVGAIHESPLLLHVDPNQMSQVFINLIDNAVQAMPEGGELRIDANPQGSENKNQKAKITEPVIPAIPKFRERRESFLTAKNDSGQAGMTKSAPESRSLTQDADFIEISVSDTGVGISRENMKKLFQPLYTTKPRGIGLGLVVCKNLTEANGGKIEVESEEGKGTTFKVILPVEKQP